MPVKGVCRARISLLVLAIMLAAILVTAGADAACAQTASFGEPHPLALGGVAGWVLAKQAMFYRSLAGMIRAAKNDGSALWALMGVSFVYGIFHAAGPGHGKAVISSYLLANEETWRRGITLSVASSLMQSIRRRSPWCDHQDDGRDAARDRGRQLWADRSRRRTPAMGQRSWAPARLARAQSAAGKAEPLRACGR